MAKKIVFQGEPGANSHLAVHEAYPDAEEDALPYIRGLLCRDHFGEADLGMIPIENSVAGRVADIHHLMPASGLHIIAEHFMPVRHQLLAVKGAKLADIKTVESHVHALGQCRKAIRKLGIKPIVAADTAGSAREIAEAGDPTPRRDRLAARRRNLRPRHPGRGYRGRGAQHHALHRAVARTKMGGGRQRAGGDDLPVPVRNVPAALYKALGGFATNGVNMTKLESYMIEGNFLATQFYADIEGHPDERNVVLALEELAFFSKELKILGVYPAHPFRATMGDNGSSGG